VLLGIDHTSVWDWFGMELICARLVGWLLLIDLSLLRSAALDRLVWEVVEILRAALPRVFLHLPQTHAMACILS